MVVGVVLAQLRGSAGYLRESKSDVLSLNELREDKKKHMYVKGKKFCILKLQGAHTGRPLKNDNEPCIPCGRRRARCPRAR